MSRLQSRLALLALVLVATVMLVPSATAQKEPTNIAAVTVGGDRVDWRPTVEYERLTLAIIGPAGFVDRQELTAGQTPSLGLFKANGERLHDGLYRYELRLLPTKGRGISDSPPATVQRGTLMVRGGSFEMPVQPGGRQVLEPSISTPSPTRRITGNDSVVADDLVVQGNACIGASCANGEPSSPNSIILKGYTPRIFFHDLNSDCNCYPARNWTIQANLNYPDYPQDELSIQDNLSGERPFIVQGGAEEDSFVISLNGKVGFGTEAPVKALHVVYDATPTLRLEQPVSPGPARTWDVGADNTQFFVSDVTNSSAQPFRIRAGAPTSSIDVSATGKVGIGTSSPATKVDVSGSDGSTKLTVRETSSTATARELAELRNNGDAMLIFTNTGGGITRYGTGLFGSSYIVDNQANGGVEFTFGSTGNLAIAGSYSSGSSRDLKTRLATLDPRTILSKVTALPVSAWSYKTDVEVRHVGPMAEDFAASFGLGEDNRHIAPADLAGVSLVALQALKTEKDAEIVQLRHQNAQLAERLAALEALVAEMGAKKQ